MGHSRRKPRRTILAAKRSAANPDPQFIGNYNLDVQFIPYLKTRTIRPARRHSIECVFPIVGYNFGQVTLPLASSFSSR